MKFKNCSHWFFQTMPPLSILFFVSENGPVLVYLFGMSVLFTFISIFSIIGKLFNFKEKRSYLVRPGLSCLVCVILFFVADISYDRARELALQEAKQINVLCNEIGKCPTKLSGWEGSGDKKNLRTKIGVRIKYPLIYYSKGSEFHIDILQGTDLGDRISGGVAKELAIIRNKD